MTDLLALGGLFTSAFLAATLLPGGSELVLGALLHQLPHLLWPAVVVATLGNTLGGLTSVWIGRKVPPNPRHPRLYQALQRWGSPILLLSWVPLIGDILCVLAGWLRLPWGWVTLWLLVGKGARYVAVAWVV